MMQLFMTDNNFKRIPVSVGIMTFNTELAQAQTLENLS
jgi:hypothetical protein